MGAWKDGMFIAGEEKYRHSRVLGGAESLSHFNPSANGEESPNSEAGVTALHLVSSLSCYAPPVAPWVPATPARVGSAGPPELTSTWNLGM